MLKNRFPVRNVTKLLLAMLFSLGGIWFPHSQADPPMPPRLIPSVSIARSEVDSDIFPSHTGCGGVYGVPSSNLDYEQEIINRVNAIRAEKDLPPLKRATSLDDAARYHATDMGQDDYFSHTSRDRCNGSLVDVCTCFERIISYYSSNWRSLGENIAAGYRTPESVMDVWMNSQGHRDNILSPGNWEIGVGYFEGAGSYYRYWVQDFGRRTGVYPLVIDREAASTDSQTVSLYIYGDWQEMRLRNNDGDWTAWQAFRSSSSWTLPGTAGDHTVWAELRDGSTTTVTSDTIRLTQSFIPILDSLPDDRSFAYSIPEGRLLAKSYDIALENTGSDQSLDWTVSTAGDWFTVSPTSGTTPGGFTISPSTFVTSTPGTYTGAVTVTVTDPPAVEGSPQRIDLKLRVSETSFSYVYLPLVMHAYSAPDSLVHPVEVNDTYFGDQWALPKVDASNAWGFSQGQGTLIAVLDTGVDLDHPDLVDKVRVDIDKDFANGDDDADDDHGHGTHVAGIAAATTDNAEGIAGLGWEADILPLKVMGKEGEGGGDILAEAIYYAADQGADVINMSLGGETEYGTCPVVVQEAVDYAYARGVVLVAASGNTGDLRSLFPANCEHVLGVAATGEGDNLASYSTSGAHVSVAAPGSDIFSTIIPWEYNGDYYYYGTMSGTSMATPHVAGLAALVRSSYPGYTPDQIASSILDNAEDLGPAGWDQDYGCGRIDAFQALAEGAQGDSPVCLEDVGAYATAAKQATAPPTAAPFVPGEIIVTLRDDLSTFQAQSIVGDAEYLPRLEAWRVRVPEGEERERLAELEAEPGVAYAELNYLVFAQ
jgi:subtilisin family serine protease